MRTNKVKYNIGLIALISSVSYAQTILPPADTPLTVQGEVRIQPENVVNVTEDVNVQLGNQFPSLEDTGNPNTFYVVQLTGDADVVTTEITSGGILAETNGNVSLFSVEQTETTVSYIRAVRLELENGTLNPQGAPIPVGGYLDEDGNFIELGVMTGLDGDGNAIFAPGDLTPAQLELITLDPVVSSLGGGNLVVGGNADVLGTLSLGSDENGDPVIEDVAAAILDNGQAILDEEAARIAADIVLQDNIDAEETARIAADIVLQDNIDAEVADRTALIRRDVEGLVRIGDNSFILDDSNAQNHRISTSTPNGNLVLGGGSNLTQVVVDSSLTVAGNTSLQGSLNVAGATTLGGSLTVAGPTALNGGLLVNGDAAVNGRLSVGAVQDVEASIIGNQQAIQQVDSRLSSEVTRLDGRISQNSRNISQNRAMIMENRAAIQANTAAISRLDNRLESVEGKAYSGVAAAASLGTLVSPSAAGKTTVMAGMGFYESEAALGVNGTHRLAMNEDKDLYINAGVSVTTDSTVLTRLMLGFEF